MSNVERHSLAWLNDAGWQAVLASTRQHEVALSQWQRHDWPVVVRRAEPDAAADEICLGLPLPPERDGAKLRLALRVRSEHVARTSDALELKSAQPFSGPWQERLTSLCNEAAALNLRVFGSLAMQALTGLQYVSPTSDIDVLFHPANRQTLEEGVALLSRHITLLPLDGEIVFPGGAAVSWKEWEMAIKTPAKVMVKELHTVRLADTASMLATLEAQ
ncbi:malonate decarboxylase holo-[acyl-carrier-protein] synthase [Duganella rivi]|nr:malonate decarboxylase holo-[acyl-carrier-protein] synthase [Duganella rivi]